MQGGVQYLETTAAVLVPIKLPLYISLILKGAEFTKNSVLALKLMVKSVGKSPISVMVKSRADVS
mgnify:CR=1 FL=1